MTCSFDFAQHYEKLLRNVSSPPLWCFCGPCQQPQVPGMEQLTLVLHLLASQLLWVLLCHLSARKPIGNQKTLCHCVCCLVIGDRISTQYWIEATAIRPLG
jgi:hypothetical protein